MKCREFGSAAGVMTIVTLAWLLAGSRCGRALGDQTTITAGSRNLPVAPLGAPNAWPKFRFQIPDSPVHVSDKLSAEDRAGMFANAVVAPMPYLIQDNYSRKRERRDVPTVQLENANLRAIFYPTLGGRMISLFDKKNQRELLFDNPVLQFANLAIRNAWFSGGVEWNGPLYGHSLLTCSPVFAGIVQTPRGPMLRLYEFDRALETTWQVDLLLPADEDRLWAHVKAINPNKDGVRFYWWTNIAVPMDGRTRVISPADYALSHDAHGNTRLPFPNFEGFDGSYPSKHPGARSIFFRKPGIAKPWSAAVDGDGRGLAHVSTATLFGRKFFTWGTGRGGKRWMDFLSEDGKGDYIEIQGGVTPTQLQTVPLAGGSSIEWTECFAGVAVDAKAAQDADYGKACAAAGKAVDRRVPDGAIREMHEFMAKQADAPVDRLLYRGAAWGWLHEVRIGRTISPGLMFEARIGEEERPWAELLAKGNFAATTLEQAPRSFVASPGWVGVLRESMRAHGATWLHHLHLGVAELEAGQFAEAREAFKSSLATKENAMAHRCLALLAERDKKIDEAKSEYQRAFKLSDGDANLAVEIGSFLVRQKDSDAFAEFLKGVPASVAGHERIAILQARIALEKGEYAAVRTLLQREYSTIREGELSLSDLWFASFIKETEKREGRALTTAEKDQIMTQNPPPRAIDFRMK